MEYFIGITLGIAVAAFAKLSGFDRDRSFYPTVAIVIASYYALFATIEAPPAILATEIAIGLGFATVAVIGFKKNMWLAAAAIAGHGAFDFLLHPAIENPGMPVWWPGFCGSIDLFLGAWVALCLWKDRTRAVASDPSPASAPPSAVAS
jgi:hypothetical protein